MACSRLTTILAFLTVFTIEAEAQNCQHRTQIYTTVEDTFHVTGDPLAIYHQNENTTYTEFSETSYLDRFPAVQRITEGYAELRRDYEQRKSAPSGPPVRPLHTRLSPRFTYEGHACKDSIDQKIQ